MEGRETLVMVQLIELGGHGRQFGVGEVVVAGGHETAPSAAGVAEVVG